jgi:hypothetical protein
MLRFYFYSRCIILIARLLSISFNRNTSTDQVSISVGIIYTANAWPELHRFTRPHDLRLARIYWHEHMAMDMQPADGHTHDSTHRQ